MGPKTIELKALCTKLGKRYVGFRGNPYAPIWVVGEAPGADEDQCGVPFVGSSGKELDRMLREAGLSQEQLCFVNPYKVRPPANDLSRFSETGISPELSREQFLEELREYRPTLILPVGGTALGILCPSTVDSRDHTAKISKWRGSILVSEGLAWPHYVISNFHPAYILREWSDRDLSVFIFRRAKEEFDYSRKTGSLKALEERELIANPTQGEIEDYLHACINHPGPTSLDIELLARRVPICIAASYNRNSAISISFFDGASRDLARTWKLLDEILRRKAIVGQNWTTFDANWMEALGFESGIARCDDTLVMHHCLHPELSHKLDFLGMQYTRLPYWKDEGRSWTLRDGMTKLKRYNCLDACATLEVFEEMSEEFLEKLVSQVGKNALLKQTMDACSGSEHKVVDMLKLYLEGRRDISTSLFTKLSLVRYQKTKTSTINVREKIASIQNTLNSLQEVPTQGNTGKHEVKSTSLEDANQDVVKSAIIEGGYEGNFENIYDFYHLYAMPLARAFFYISKKGVYTDAVALAKLRKEVVDELDQRVITISKNLGGRAVAYSADMATKLAKALSVPPKSVLNIASPAQLKTLLVDELKVKLKSIRSKDQNGQTKYNETTNDDSLNEAFAATGNPVLKDILRIRELNKILGTNIDARLGDSVFYSCYSVTGTVTGRRASRKNFLGYGSNGQNQPKHSDLGEKFQRIFIARPGYIYAYCDQASAEEWFVQGIIADVSGDDKGIRELKRSIETGVSRHAVLASQIFGLPIDKTNNKECLEYYVGKKVRHAGNYDMHADKMAAVMASEGFPTSKSFCQAILDKFHAVEPAIKQVFHHYVERELCTKKLLRTPLGRERVFHGLRPYGDNSKIFREGYAYIPQSSVGDNNGLAILWMSNHDPGKVILDGHDSMLCECKDSFDELLLTLRNMQQAYKRVFRFPVSGFEVEVPVDFKIGFSIQGMVKCGDTNEETVRKTYEVVKGKILRERERLLDLVGDNRSIPSGELRREDSQDTCSSV